MVVHTFAGAVSVDVDVAGNRAAVGSAAVGSAGSSEENPAGIPGTRSVGKDLEVHLEPHSGRSVEAVAVVGSPAKRPAVLGMTSGTCGTAVERAGCKSVVSTAGFEAAGSAAGKSGPGGSRR